MSRASTLTRDRWADAALEALARGGPAAVSVEPLARALGVTKGSFYHHFTGREELLRAALARWEALGTDGLLERLAPLDPTARLEVLFQTAREGALEPRWAVLAQLAAHASDPDIAPVLARATERRLRFLARTWESAGLPPDESERRALLAYTAYLGMVQLAVSAPDCVPRGDALHSYVSRVLELLVPGGGAPA